MPGGNPVTAYATGGLTPESTSEPDGWPDGWTWPPTVVDDTSDPPLWLWPPGWPPVWFDTAYTKVLTCATTDILFVNTDIADATSPDTAVVSYTVDITAVGGGAYTDTALNNHRMAVWIADSDGNTISEVDGFAIAVGGGGVTQMTGSLTATVDKDTMATVTLKAQILSLRADTAATQTLTVSTVDLNLSVSSACNSGTLESSVGVADNDGTWGTPTVTAASVVEE